MKVIAIDFDGTLTTPDGIVRINRLYEDKNNFIVIHTSRSDVIRKQTEQELYMSGAKYHALVMNKLRADIYIDDKNTGGLNWII